MDAFTRRHAPPVAAAGAFCFTKFNIVVHTITAAISMVLLEEEWQNERLGIEARPATLYYVPRTIVLKHVLSFYPDELEGEEEGEETPLYPGVRVYMKSGHEFSIYCRYADFADVWTAYAAGTLSEANTNLPAPFALRGKIL